MAATVLPTGLGRGQAITLIGCVTPLFEYLQKSWQLYSIAETGSPWIATVPRGTIHRALKRIKCRRVVVGPHPGIRPSSHFPITHLLTSRTKKDHRILKRPPFPGQEAKILPNFLRSQEMCGLIALSCPHNGPLPARTFGT
jgi:hypothetical protein